MKTVVERRYDKPGPTDFAACEVPPELAEQLPKRFRELTAPFGDLLESDADRYYFHAILEGLAAEGRKNLESIAYAHDHDRQSRQTVLSSSSASRSCRSGSVQKHCRRKSRPKRISFR